MAQAQYKHNQTGEIIAFADSVPGSGNYDMPVTPAGNLTRKGARPRLGFTRATQKGRVDWAQFGLNKYFDPAFRFSCELNPSYSLAQLKSFGFSAFHRGITDAERDSLVGEYLEYRTESSIHGAMEGVDFFECTIEEYFNQVWTIGGGRIQNTVRPKYFVFNIETSNEWYPGNVSAGAYPGFSVAGSYGTQWSADWNASKGKVIKLETSGQNSTIEALANQGQGVWENEMRTRRANRLVMLMQVARHDADPAGILVSYGACAFQGLPNKATALTGTEVFNGGTANGQFIGADGNGNRTFANGAITIKFIGDQYTWENIHWNYDYPGHAKMLESDYNDIFLGSDSSKKNYEYYWSKLRPIHEGAISKGRIEAMWHRMAPRHGGSLIPVAHMVEMLEEQSTIEIVTAGGGHVRNVEVKNPDPALLETVPIGGATGGVAYYDTPKIWFPPYFMYTKYAWHRFLVANQPNSCWHIFEDKTPFRQDGGTSTYTPMYQHNLDPMGQMLHGRHDMQRYEGWIGASVLVKDPAVKREGQSSFETYNGVEAFNYENGSYGQQRPAASLRYIDRGNHWEILVIISHGQGHAVSRTDTLKVDGLFNGAQFEVEYTGPSAVLFPFIVPKTAPANQIYPCIDTDVPAWNKPGYASRINNP